MKSLGAGYLDRFSALKNLWTQITWLGSELMIIFVDIDIFYMYRKYSMAFAENAKLCNF